VWYCIEGLAEIEQDCICLATVIQALGQVFNGQDELRFT
jgi:hypothetical protein